VPRGPADGLRGGPGHHGEAADRASGEHADARGAPGRSRDADEGARGDDGPDDRATGSERLEPPSPRRAARGPGRAAERPRGSSQRARPRPGSEHRLRDAPDGAPGIARDAPHQPRGDRAGDRGGHQPPEGLRRPRMATAHLNGSYGNGREAVALPPMITPRRAATMPSRTRLLGELLLREGLVTEGQLTTALRAQEARLDGTPIGQLLVEQGALSPADLEAVLRRYHKKYRLGDILVETNVISETQLQLGVDHHRRTGLRLGDALLQLGFVNEEMLKLALCTQLDVTFVDLDRFSMDRALASLL